jgi:hypothetical protein
VASEEVLAELEQTLSGLKAAGRVMSPARLIGPLTAQVALVEAIRRRSVASLRNRWVTLQARYGEALSWMAEESGDLSSALFWADRVEHWAQLGGWPAMAAYARVRRSMLAISHANDGMAAVEQAQLALLIPGTPPRVQALGYKQIAYGYALLGEPDASRYALDRCATLFASSSGGDSSRQQHLPGQNSVADQDLLAIFAATCDVYLGAGDRVMSAMTPRLSQISTGSQRTSAITAAKLAQASAQAGEPGQACSIILETLDRARVVDSWTTWSELHRAVPLLARWSTRDDVREVTHRLGAGTGR